jgi:hypothetical protein
MKSTSDKIFEAEKERFKQNTKLKIAKMKESEKNNREQQKLAFQKEKERNRIAQEQQKLSADLTRDGESAIL